MKITQMMCPESQYKLKCPRVTEKKVIIVHNTDNNASAMAEVSYMIGNSRSTSFHAAVDEDRIVQGIPEERNTWSCGDGSNGFGNNYGYSIEICRNRYDSDHDKFIQAEKNAAEYIAFLLHTWGLGIDKVTQHHDYNGKNCPSKTRKLGWDRFLKMIQAELDEYNVVVGDYEVVAPVKGYKTASDSVNRVNPANIKPAGLYFTYKSVDGAVNISNSAGTPGSWINPKDNVRPNYSKLVASKTSARKGSKRFAIGETVRVEAYLRLRVGPATTEDIVRIAVPGEFLKLTDFLGDWGKAFDPKTKKVVWFSLQYCV